MNNATATATATVAQRHDLILLELLAARQTAVVAIDRAIDYAKHDLNIRRRDVAYDLSNAQVIVLVEAKPAADRVVFHNLRTWGDLLAELRAKYATLSDASQAVRTHELGYTGWTRFFLLTSSDGHVHSSMNCSTCNKGRSSSTFALWAELSGVEIDAAVDKLGPALCSVCYPTAPVAWQDAVRIPASLALVLLDKGGDAFEAAQAVAAKKAADKAAAQCLGSGTYVPLLPGQRYTDYRTCGHCGQKVKVLTNANLRKHAAK
jgi:hypothetical protein